MFCCSNQLKIAANQAAKIDPIFWELTVGYISKDEEWIDMSQPRPCSYSRSTDADGNPKETKQLGQPQHDPLLQESEYLVHEEILIPSEQRGITRRQLRAILANVRRRCVPEGWTNREGKNLQPSNVTLYDINKYIIKPFTKISQKSLVETLPSTAGTQPPRWFVSHWWGESVEDFMACIEQHGHDFRENYMPRHTIRGAGVTSDTPLWICAYANNQWNLYEASMDSPGDSAFVRAMEVANFRTLTIFDQLAMVLTRIWCILELNMTLMMESKDSGNGETTNSLKRLWAVYTAHGHKFLDRHKVELDREAVGIVSGGVPSDIGVAAYTSARESHFPSHLLFKSTNIKVEEANATVEADRNAILNYIIGNHSDLHTKPPEANAMYTALNETVAGNFAASTAVLQSTLRRGKKDEFYNVLVAMSKSTTRSTMMFNFSQNQGWGMLGKDQAADLIKHLPTTIEGLKIDGAPYGGPFISALADWITRCKNLKSLAIVDTCVGNSNKSKEGKEMGVLLAKALKSTKSKIEEVRIWCTDLIGSRNGKEWGNVIAKMASLKRFECDGMRSYLDRVDLTTLADKQFIVKSPYDGRQEVYYTNGVFPDGMLLDQGYQALMKGMRQSTSLTSVSLHHHGIGKTAIESIGDALKKNETIVALEIWEDGNTREEVISACEKLRQDLFTTGRTPRVDILCI